MAVFVAQTLVQQLISRSRKGVENTWSLAMDKLVRNIVDSMVVLNDASLALFRVVATDPVGQTLVQEMVREKDWLGWATAR